MYSNRGNLMENASKRFAYLRCSSSLQDTNHQRNAILSSKYIPDEWFSDDAVSGTVAAVQRPEFLRMMEQAVEGDEVCVVAVDRLGRNAADILATVELFIKKKVKLRIHAFDNIDITSMYGKLLVQFLAVFAELDRAQIISRVKSGNDARKKSGIIMGRANSINPKVLENMQIDKASGMTLNALAEKYDFDRGTIGRNLKKWSGKIAEYEAAFNARFEQSEDRRLAKIAELQAR
jgi:putative DNA-invertase from lambdoid prophage Rac